MAKIPCYLEYIRSGEPCRYLWTRPHEFYVQQILSFEKNFSSCGKKRYIAKIRTWERFDPCDRNLILLKLPILTLKP